MTPALAAGTTMTTTATTGRTPRIPGTRVPAQARSATPRTPVTPAPAQAITAARVTAAMTPTTVSRPTPPTRTRPRTRRTPGLGLTPTLTDPPPADACQRTRASERSRGRRRGTHRRPLIESPLLGACALAAGDRPRDPPRVGAHVAELAAHRGPVADEEEARSGGVVRAALDVRIAGAVQYPEMADQRLELGAVAGRHEHDLGPDPFAAGEQHVSVLEALDRANELDPARPERCDEPRVDQRRLVLAADPGLQPDGRAADPVRRQVAEHRALRPAGHAVADPVGKRVRGNRRVVGRKPEDFAAKDRRRATHRGPHPRRAALRQLEGDLRSGVRGRHDEHVLAAERLRLAVRGGVDQLAGKPLPPRPLGHHRAAVVAGRDHDACRGQIAGRGLDPPPAVVAVDAPHLGPGADVEVEPARVLAQVLDHVVLGRPAPVAARHPVARQGRGEPRSVESQALVARRPRGPDVRSALQYHRRDAAPVEHRGDREPSGSPTRDEHRVARLHARSLRAEPGARP